MKKVNEYFTVNEFICKCGKCKSIPEELEADILYLAKQLRIIRQIVNAPIIINSGIRCYNHNKRIGGVKNSRHLKGQAVEIRSTEYTAVQLYNIIEAMRSKGIIYLGYTQLYRNKGFVHIDTRNRIL